MWNKIYLVALGLSIALMAFFTYYSFSWLESIGLPAAAVEGYEYHSGLACSVLIFTGIALLMLANGVLWATQRAWAMWATFAYVAVFVIVRYFWLGEAYFRFRKTNGMFDGSFSLGPVMGVILVVAAGVLIFANQFGSVRLYRKLYPATAVEPEQFTETQSDVPPTSE